MTGFKVNKGVLTPYKKSIPDLVRTLVDETEIELTSYEDWFKLNCQRLGYEFFMGDFYSINMIIEDIQTTKPHVINFVEISNEGEITFINLQVVNGWKDSLEKIIKENMSALAGGFNVLNEK